jgi:hypothetical protein
LKSPAADGEKGVLYVSFEHNWLHLIEHCDMPKLLEYYLLAVESSWSQRRRSSTLRALRGRFRSLITGPFRRRCVAAICDGCLSYIRASKHWFTDHVSRMSGIQQSSQGRKKFLKRICLLRYEKVLCASQSVLKDLRSNICSNLLLEERR